MSRRVTMRVLSISLSMFFFIVLGTACLPQIANITEDISMSESRGSKKRWSNAPEMQIDENAVYEATIETEQGIIVLELYPEHAPQTVNNFVFLSREGFYDGVVFHRVIPHFMIQGGDPTGTGRGGPGYKFADEVKSNPLTHETGVISMANAGPNTNGSQFFITHGPQPHLDGKHTVFGRVVQGQDIVDAIAQGDTIVQVTIREK